VSRPGNDLVTLAIGQAVQRYILSSLDLSPLPEGVTGVEAHAVGELDTGVVVTTAEGNRYFLVRVAEFTTR
jgi:hypothetical protein